MAKRSTKTTLTPRQREIYEFLRDKILNRGYGPTVREIGGRFGIRSPNGVMCHLKALERKGLISRESHMSRAIQLADSPKKRMSIPLAGTVTGNKPLRAAKPDERVDFGSFFDSTDQICVRIKGDGLAHDELNDGDMVIAKKQSNCKTGDVVVAVVNGREATVKRFHRERSRVRLDDVNSKSNSIYPDELEILGVVVGLMRKM